MDVQMQQAEDIDVDNLFNEENLNNAALGGGILSENAILQDNVFGATPAQTEHIAELTVNGSLNSLTWARPGVIARINESGDAVETLTQRVDVKTGKWILTQPRPLDGMFENAVGLAWSTTGAELAVLDRKGRVHTYNIFPTAVNRFATTRSGSLDQADELNQPIGALWLNLSRGPQDKKKTVLENVKESGRWKHEHIEGGFHPPHTVRAFCLIGRSGKFTLLFTGDASAFKKASLALPGTSTATMFTHAAIAQTPEGKLLVALHEAGGDISTYSINMLFTHNASLSSLKAESIDPKVPATPPSFDIVDQSISDMTDGCVLTHLHILPESEYSLDHLNKPHLSPKQPATLVAVYSAYSSQKNAAANGVFGTTVLKRWHFQTSQFDLCPMFGGNATGDSDPVQTNLQPLSDTLMPAVIMNLQTLEPGNAMSITTLDGTTTFWDPDTMTPISADEDFQMVSSIGQMNLDYSPATSGTTQCLSPHALALANIDDDGKLRTTFPKYRDFDTTSSQPPLRHLDPSNPTDEALIAGYILSFSRSCWHSNSTFDDILSSIQSTIHPTSLIHIRRQLLTTLFAPKNLVPGPSNVSELDKVPHSMIVYKALAFSFGLFATHHYPSEQEHLAHLWTWIVLNLRWSIAIIGDTYKSLHSAQPQQQGAPGQPAAPPQPNVLPSAFLDLVSSNIRWVFALSNHLISSILTTGDRASHPQFFPMPPSSLHFPSHLGDTTGTGTQGLTALLLNCNWSRSFLLIMARLMKALATKAGVNINFNNPENNEAGVASGLVGTTLGRVASTIQTCCLENGITVGALETLFEGRLAVDRWEQDGGGSGNEQVMARQIEMIVSGRVGDVYQGTVERLLEECINGDDGLRAQGDIDRYRLSQGAEGAGYLFLGMLDGVLGDREVVMRLDARAAYPAADGGFDDVLQSDTNGERRKQKGKRVLYDIHKKLPLFSHQSQAIVPASPAAQQGGGGKGLPKVTSTEELLAAQVRRCVRCGSLSDSNVEGTTRGWPRQVVSLMNKCACDGSWIVEGVGEGMGLGMD